MDLLMGLDLGSTSLKAIVYDLEGNAVARGSRPTERSHPNPDRPEWTVWEPEKIWDGAAGAVREAMAALDQPQHVRGVAVTGMGMDGLPVDEHGQWLYPMISWHDPRTQEQLGWWLENVGAEKTFSIGGNPVWAINTALRILWVQQHEPEIFARAARWLLIEDFLNYMLTGRMVTDYSMASCTMVFDQRQRDWSDEMLAASGLPRHLFPEALPSGTPIGHVQPAAAEATGLPEGTPVMLGGHDHICGALPVGACKPGVVLDVTGTWESVLATVPEPVLDDSLRQMGMTVQAHVARDRHAVWGGAVAAEMLEWYRRECGPAESDWDELIALAEASPPGARGALFLPHMSGAACPRVDSQSLGAFAGLSGHTTRGDMLRAVFEGLDYQFLDIATALQQVLHIEIDKLVAVGGATRNGFWMQNKADVVGRPVEVPDVDEATPLGAAILAGIGLGLYENEDDALRRVYRVGTTYEPDEARHAQYARWFETYRELYPALRPISHRLHGEFLA
jgi:xylulokinase